jgi:hypothetical protein
MALLNKRWLLSLYWQNPANIDEFAGEKLCKKIPKDPKMYKFI